MSKEELSDIEKLKAKAAFKFPEIAEGLDKLLAAQEAGNAINNNILLSKLDQKIRDTEQYKTWRRQKNQSTVLSIVAIFIAVLAIAVAADVDIAKGASNLFSSIAGLFS